MVCGVYSFHGTCAFTCVFHRQEIDAYGTFQLDVSQRVSHLQAEYQLEQAHNRQADAMETQTRLASLPVRRRAALPVSNMETDSEAPLLPAASTASASTPGPTAVAFPATQRGAHAAAAFPLHTHAQGGAHSASFSVSPSGSKDEADTVAARAGPRGDEQAMGTAMSQDVQSVLHAPAFAHLQGDATKSTKSR
jgi:hypothetical protein